MKPFNLREHKETITSTNTIITNPLVNQKEPIMSNKVKLYTEEQIRRTVYEAQEYFRHYDYEDAEDRIEKHLKALQPIELPSDEEIEQFADKFYDNNYTDAHIKIGANWVIDKIKNQQRTK